jgi:hypothetical protein
MNTTSTSTPEPTTFGAMVAEIVPLVGAVAGYGPPVIFMAGPWVLLALVLAGPFAFLLVLVTFMLVAATIVGTVVAAILAGPYLLVGRLRDVRARRALGNRPAAQLVAVRSTRVPA